MSNAREILTESRPDSLSDENKGNMSMRSIRFTFCLSSLICLAAMFDLAMAEEMPDRFRIASFHADVTIPLGHRCMGILPTKSVKIVDPLEARGFVLWGADKPIVFVAIDWCEIRNGAYDQWREALAAAADTTRERVLVCSLHQHDAPVTDAGAAKLLQDVNLPGELYDVSFHAQAIQRVVQAMKQAIEHPQRVTHLGTGQARIEKIASNRRVILENGKVSFGRGSRSGSNPFHRDAPRGEVDEYVKTISFWDGEKPLVALSVYATHPMSYYGQGEVSADFVGLARRQRQQETPGVFQIYASGCSGDVTAGKYNDGSRQSRIELTKRLAAGMKAAWEQTKRTPLESLAFRSAELKLDYYEHRNLDPDRLRAILNDSQAKTEKRILAAMGLSSYERVQRGQAIDFPCLDFGTAQLILFPAESFVRYQLMAQSMRPDSFVVSVGYGECWPGYIPSDAAFADGFHDTWLWVGPGSEKAVRQALKKVLLPE